MATVTGVATAAGMALARPIFDNEPQRRRRRPRQITINHQRIEIDPIKASRNYRRRDMRRKTGKEKVKPRRNGRSGRKGGSRKASANSENIAQGTRSVEFTTTEIGRDQYGTFADWATIDPNVIDRLSGHDQSLLSVTGRVVSETRTK